MSKTPAERAFRRHVETIAAGDREGWLENFADDAVMEDPVGPSPLDPSGEGHQGKGAIAAFWDRVIGPCAVRFEIERHINCGDEIANIGTVYNRLPGSETEIAAEGVFVYRVNAEGKLVSLKAYWDYEATMAGAVLPD